MRILLLFLVLATSMFAQHAHFSAPHFYYRPAPVIASPRFGYGFGYYGNYGWDYSYYPYPTYFPGQTATGCKKETLKDSNKQKHDVLVCRQLDGSFKVVADANVPQK